MSRADRAPHQRGVTLVEFALVAPVFFVLILGLLLLGIVVMNQMQLTNAVRDGVRAAFGVTLEPEPTLVGVTL